MEEFEEAYRALFPQVYRYLLALCRDPELAEELTQETFFHGIQHIEAFRGECRLYVWLCQIGKRQYFSWLRRQRSRRMGSSAEGQAADPEVEWLERETAEELRRSLDGMEEPYREVFSLRVFGELPFRQIAQMFGKTESWARVTYHRARLKLKEEIQRTVRSYRTCCPCIATGCAAKKVSSWWRSTWRTAGLAPLCWQNCGRGLRRCRRRRRRRTRGSRAASRRSAADFP